MLVKNPLLAPEDCVIEMSGFTPPLELIGAVAVTLATPPPPPPTAFKVVPVNDKLVPRIISSIAPVPAVPRPTNLFVAIEVETLGVAPPLDVIGVVAVTLVIPPPPPPVSPLKLARYLVLSTITISALIPSTFKTNAINPFIVSPPIVFIVILFTLALPVISLI